MQDAIDFLIYSLGLCFYLFFKKVFKLIEGFSGHSKTRCLFNEKKKKEPYSKNIEVVE